MSRGWLLLFGLIGASLIPLVLGGSDMFSRLRAFPLDSLLLMFGMIVVCWFINGLRLRADATEVDVSELVFSVLSSIKDPDTVPFGSAFPSPQLFPLPRLARSMAHAVRDMDPQSVVADMTPGNHGLRRQIALRYMVGGLLLPVEELVISNGALEALNLCLQVVTRPGDLVAIERRRSTPPCRCWNG